MMTQPSAGASHTSPATAQQTRQQELTTREVAAPGRERAAQRVQQAKVSNGNGNSNPSPLLPLLAHGRIKYKNGSTSGCRLPILWASCRPSAASIEIAFPSLSLVVVCCELNHTRHTACAWRGKRESGRCAPETHSAHLLACLLKVHQAQAPPCSI